MTQAKKLLTRKQAKAQLVAKGLTVRQWAQDNGFHERTVYEVLRGAKKGLYGDAHRVAVALGIKQEVLE